MSDPMLPLRGRYPSKEMRGLFPDPGTDYRHKSSTEMRDVFSKEAKYLGWRRNWVVLPTAQQALGLNISDEHLAAIRAAEKNIDFEAAAAYEREKKHDVMAYLQEFSDRADEICPGAGGDLHEGATSCYVTDNQELVAMRDALKLVYEKAHKLWSDHGITDLYLPLQQIQVRQFGLRARGAKGTTGTQASYLGLFNGDHEKVQRLDQMVATELGFDESYVITGQTYPRIVDYQVISSVAVLANVLARGCPQFQEVFEDIHNRATQAAQMASNQWLERSLDDSSERRIMMTETFYAIDYVLDRIAEDPSLFKSPGPIHEEPPQKALDIVSVKLINVIDKIHSFAEDHRDTLCTAYTHGQFAQPTTYGKRLDLWAYNFALALKDIQAYRLKDDNYLVNMKLNQVAIAAAKMALDVRLLQHDLEVNEPFGISQKGSTAMPFKKNPMKCERINGLARHKIGSTVPGRLGDYDWLTTDAILELSLAVFARDTPTQKGFTIHPQRAQRNLAEFMPFLAVEDIMLAESAAGGSRQDLHEEARLACLAARQQVDQGRPNNVLALMRERGFTIDPARESEYLDPATHVGRSREQVDEFGEKIVKPLREQYAHLLGQEGDVQV
ncbi:lyase family protein [Nanoarchaeota archaeon]